MLPPYSLKPEIIQEITRATKAMAIVGGHPGAHVVETGVFLGKSASYWGEAIRRSGKAIRFDAVDSFEGVPEAEPINLAAADEGADADVRAAASALWAATSSRSATSPFLFMTTVMLSRPPKSFASRTSSSEAARLMRRIPVMHTCS